jgi:hypothetical protein
MARYYVDPDKFRAEILISQRNNVLTADATQMLMLMVNRIQRPLPYISKDLRDDCNAHALMIVMHKWTKFNPLVSQNAFAYFSRIIFNGLTDGLNRYTKPNTTHISIDALFANEDKSDY